MHLGVDLGIGGLHGACGKALDGVDAHIGPHQGEGFFDHAVHGGGAPVDVFVELFLLLGGPAVAVRQFIHKVASLRQLCPCGLNFRHVHSVAGGPLDLLKGGQRGVQGGGDLFEHGAHAVIEGHLGLDSCHCLTTLKAEPPPSWQGLRLLVFLYFAFQLRLSFLFILTADLYGGDDKGPLMGG